MKATALAAAVLAGGAAVVSASPDTHAYILRANAAASSEFSPAPTLAVPVARAILHQRLSPADRSPVALHDLVGADASAAASATALQHIAAFGRPAPRLFERPVDAPGQDVIIVEGLGDGEAKVLGAGLGGAAFVLDGTVAPEENSWLVEELLGVGVTDAVRVNVKENPDELDNLISHLAELRRRADAGIAETVVLAFPDATKAKTLQRWSAAPALRRRQDESVMTETDADPNAAPSSHITIADPESGAERESEDDDGDDNADLDAAPGTSPNPSAPFAAITTPVAACFASLDDCVAGTGNCTEHGQCRNRWGAEAGAEACWACHCLMSADGTQWGGNVCQKVDISGPFWLLAGTSLALVYVLGGGIAMLYAVGEQKLPGVIGAGVSVKK
jgi:hypothetical protein